MPALVAVDTRRGWMLMRDGGEQLRASIRPTKDVTPWNPVSTRYAEVQMGLAEHVLEMLALGIPDHRLASLPALYTQLLRDEESLRIDQEKGLTFEEWEQMKAMRPRFEQICSELADFGIPESLNHGDFHDGNVLVRDKRITFFDWGDVSLTHPFVSLRTLFVSVEIALVINRQANQLASGLAMMFLGFGLSALIGNAYVGLRINGLPRILLPGLSDLPILWTSLFKFDILIYLAIPVAFLVWWLRFRTRWGLGLRAVGENTDAAFASGRNPRLIRYQALFFGGLLAGLGAAHLSIAYTMTWGEHMTGGHAS